MIILSKEYAFIVAAIEALFLFRVVLCIAPSNHAYSYNVYNMVPRFFFYMVYSLRRVK